MNNSNFGRRVKAKRLALGLSQEQLGKLVGLSQVSIRKIEAGGSTRHGRLLAESLKTTLEWLETGYQPGEPSDLAENLLFHENKQTIPSPLTNKPALWPFDLFSFEQYQQLPEKTKGIIEGYVFALLNKPEDSSLQLIEKK